MHRSEPKTFTHKKRAATIDTQQTKRICASVCNWRQRLHGIALHNAHGMIIKKILYSWSLCEWSGCGMNICVNRAKQWRAAPYAHFVQPTSLCKIITTGVFALLSLSRRCAAGALVFYCFCSTYFYRLSRIRSHFKLIPFSVLRLHFNGNFCFRFVIRRFRFNTRCSSNSDTRWRRKEYEA